MRAVVFGNNEVIIPAWVVDHTSFCEWALSDDYPEHGRFGFFNDNFWGDLDLESEEHNVLKTVIGPVLTMLVINHKLGLYYSDRMMLSHTEVGLATEPDGMFVRAETRRSGRVTVRRGQVGRGRGVILEGTPDMVLEVVSPSSVRKDTVEMFDLYWQAGIREYWLVDPRGDEPRFTLYSRTARGYRTVRPADGWRKSAVFGAAFRLVQSADGLGLPAYTLQVR